MARLEDVCEILDSRRIPITASNRISGPYPYYGANGVQDYVADYIFDDELVLLAEDGGNFGSKDRPIAYRVSGKCWVNNHAHVLKPKEGINVIFDDVVTGNNQYIELCKKYGASNLAIVSVDETHSENRRYKSQFQCPWHFTGFFMLHST